MKKLYDKLHRIRKSVEVRREQGFTTFPPEDDTELVCTQLELLMRIIDAQDEVFDEIREMVSWMPKVDAVYGMSATSASHDISRVVAKWDNIQ